MFADADNLKRRFIEHFSGVHSREGTVAAFRGCKYVPGESMETYLAKLRGYAERLGYDDDLIADQFREGLPYDIRIQVSMARCNTLDELVETAQKYSDLTSSKQKEVSFSTTELLCKIESLETCMANMQTNYSRNNEQRGRPKSPHSRTQSFRSHSRSRSPYHRDSRDSRNSRRNDNKIKCNYCGKEGHKWRQCRKLSQDMGSKTQGDRSRSRDRQRSHSRENKGF